MLRTDRILAVFTSWFVLDGTPGFEHIELPAKYLTISYEVI